MADDDIETRDLNATLTAFLHQDESRPVPGSGLAQSLGKVIPRSWRPGVRRVVTNLLSFRERSIARRLARRSPLKLNLGCGTLALQGWVNIDLVGLPVDLRWNIGHPLPFDSGIVDAIFHEHVLEHLPPAAGLNFLKECHRLLRPRGVMRIVVPDAERYIRSYVDPTHEFLNSWRPGRLTPLLGLQEEFYEFGHRALYDFATLSVYCRAVGFRTIDRKQFGESAIEPCPDSEWRKVDSLYTEMVKS